MNDELVISRMVIPEEDGEWIPRVFWPGERVYEYNGPTYGCIDWTASIAVTEKPGETPFFQFPVDALARPLELEK